MLKFIILLLTTTVLLAGCGLDGGPKAPVVPPGGFLYTNHRAPLTPRVKANTPADGDLGISECHFIRLPIPYLSPYLTFSWGDASIEAAAKESRVTKVNYADYEYLNILSIYGRFRTRTWGR